MNVINDPNIIAEIQKAQANHQSILHIKDSSGDEIEIILFQKEISSSIDNR